MTGGVEVQGAARLQTSLHAASKKVLDLSGPNAEVARVVIAAAQPPRLSGALAGSLRARSSATEASVESGLPYAAVIENGWPGHNIAATHFLREAFASSQDAATAVYERSLQSTLDDVKGA